MSSVSLNQPGAERSLQTFATLSESSVYTLPSGGNPEPVRCVVSSSMAACLVAVLGENVAQVHSPIDLPKVTLQGARSLVGYYDTGGRKVS